MSDLHELYQEVILDHSRRPRAFGPLPTANRTADGVNPLCGDRLRLYLDVGDGCIRDVRFEGVGCAISKASASLMAEAVRGRPVADAEALFERVHRLLTSDEPPPEDDEGVGKLVALAGVRRFPLRVKCATLPWHTLRAALAQHERTTTE
jgi:nitrogen fixation NifU-like protein